MEKTASVLGREIYLYSMRNASKDHVVSDYAVHSVKVPFAGDEAIEYEEINERMRPIAMKLYAGCPELEDLYSGDFYRKLGELASGSGDLAGLALAYRALMFRRKNIINLARFRVPCACELVKALAGGRVIVFAERIQTVNHLFSVLSRLYPQKARRYHSEMEPGARRNALEAYKDGEANILLSCKALDEGLNVPDTDAGIIVSATAGIRQRIQRLGRVLRLSPAGGVKNVYYLYVDGSREDPSLLDGVPAGEDLSFEPETGRMRNPEYEAYAGKVLEKFSLIHAGHAGGQTISRAQWEELERNIYLGAFRGDYRLPLARINENAGTAGVKAKNYWIAMGLVARRMEREGR